MHGKTWMLLLPCLFGMGAIGSRAVEGPGREASPAVVNPPVRSDLQRHLSLDGRWDFVPDPEKKGEAEQWFAEGKKPSGGGQIDVPAAWAAQGHRDYQGAAWYFREVLLPAEWAGQRVWLKIGAVNAQGWFWVNGTYLGHLNHYCGTYKYEITGLVGAGGAVKVAARVRNDLPSLKGLQNHVGTFGGLVRSVELEATPAVAIDYAWAEPRYDARGVRICATIRATHGVLPQGQWTLSVLARSAGQAYALAGHAHVALEAARGATGETREVALELPLDPFRPWSPHAPNLYVADLRLEQDGQAVHGWAERFGVRKWEVRGGDFYLNDRPFYYFGFGDDWIYPLTFCSPADRAVHRTNLQSAKDYGFNYVRLHTHVEHAEYFDAADEVGIMVQPEYTHFYGVDIYDAPRVAAMKTGFLELIAHMRRHVSLATYCVGNEGWIGSPADQEIYQMVKALDPTRLMIHQDGGNNLENNSDFTTSWATDFGRPESFSWKSFNRADKNSARPHVLHEYTNLAAELDPRTEPKWRGAVPPPVRLKDFQNQMASLGLTLEEGLRIIDAGLLMQRDEQKFMIEDARKVPWLDGYCFWTIVDYYPMCSQGLLDAFWGPKKTPISFLRQFNSPLAVLARNVPPRPVAARAPKPAADAKAPGVFLIAGQSNASGRSELDEKSEQPDPRVTMFGHDDQWKTATEPTDDATGQRDAVSADPEAGHSFALRAARDLVAAGIPEAKLIPSALGATAISAWRKTAKPEDPATLFGSAIRRARAAAQGRLTALWWYQGESDRTGTLEQYLEKHTELVKDSREVLGADLPIVQAQCARLHGEKQLQHHIAEAQRRLETGSGYSAALPRLHLVATFDLPLRDMGHINAEAMRELGRRVALATRQHVYGEAVDGTGPRVVRIHEPDGRHDVTRVVFNQPVNESVNNYDRQFRVFDREKELEVLSALRDPADPHAVLVTTKQKATWMVRISYGDVAEPELGRWLRNVVKGAHDLPAPAFGPLVVGEEACATPNDRLHLGWMVSNFSDRPIDGQAIHWTLRDGDREIASGKTPQLNIAADICTDAGGLTLDLPAADRAIRATLEARVEGMEPANTWPLWIFPRGGARSGERFEDVEASPRLHREIAGRYPGMRLARTPGDAAPVLVTDDPGAALEALEAGRRVLLLGILAGERLDTPTELGWWGKTAQTGTMVADHPAFGNFPHAGYLDGAFARIVRRAEKIGAIHQPVNKLMAGGGAGGHFLYAYQARAGKGRILCTTLGLLEPVPEAGYLLDQFLRYVRSEAFAPAGTIDPAAVQAYREKTMGLRSVCNGYDRLVRAQDSRPAHPSFTEPMDLHLVRAQDGAGELAWLTQPVAADQDPAAPCTLRWAAALGYMTEPAATFVLHVNGAPVVTIEAILATATWTGVGGTTLRYDVERKFGDMDACGMMTLTIPGRLVEAGKPAEIRITGSKSDSMRWIGVFDVPK